MRRRARIRRVEEKVNTTHYQFLGESPPMKSFFPNTEIVSSLPFDTEELVLTISDESLAGGEVSIAFPPVPFYRELKSTVRYEHRVERRGKDRRAANTPELPVTLVYVNKSALDDDFIAAQKPIHFGLSPVTESVEDDEVQAGTEDIAIDGESARADALAVFDDFIKESVRECKGGRLTSRQIWGVWAARWDTSPADRMIAGVRYTDVSRRIRATVGAAAAKNPTRIDGSLQRYWPNYTIQASPSTD